MGSNVFAPTEKADCLSRWPSDLMGDMVKTELVSGSFPANSGFALAVSTNRAPARGNVANSRAFLARAEAQQPHIWFQQPLSG